MHYAKLTAAAAAAANVKAICAYISDTSIAAGRFSLLSPQYCISSI